MWFAHFFFQFISFSFSQEHFWGADTVHFDEVRFVKFSHGAHTFGAISKKSLLSSRSQKMFSYIFFVEVLWCQVLLFKSMIHFKVFFFVYDLRRYGSRHFFIYRGLRTFIGPRTLFWIIYFFNELPLCLCQNRSDVCIGLNWLCILLSVLLMYLNSKTMSSVLFTRALS